MRIRRILNLRPGGKQEVPEVWWDVEARVGIALTGPLVGGAGFPYRYSEAHA